jgi:hypothetical protein
VQATAPFLMKFVTSIKPRFLRVPKNVEFAPPVNATFDDFTDYSPQYQ